MEKKSPKKLFIRFSTKQDEQKIFDFYVNNQHTFVFQRDPNVWKERISSGAVTLIENAAGEIVAASISYPIMKKDATGNDVHTWTEIGSTRVAFDGIGLFNPLVSAQILRAFLLEPPADRFVLEIILGNDHSKYVFGKIGAKPYAIPEELAEQVKVTIAPGSGQAKVEWFSIGAETIPDLAKFLLSLQKNSLLKHKVTGEEYEIDFSRCVLMTQFQKDLSDLAKQDPNPSSLQGLKKDYRF